MENKIYIYELPCYKMIDVEIGSHIYKCRNRCFHLDNMPTKGLQKEFRAFLEYRGNGKNIKAFSLSKEVWYFNIISRFVNDCHKDMESLLEISEDEMIRDLKKWLIKNGYQTTNMKYKKSVGKEERRTNDNINYLKRVYAFLNMGKEDDTPEQEKDIWELAKLPMELRLNPILTTKTLNFSKISQSDMRKEIKMIEYMRLKNKAVGTIQCEINALNRFSHFLEENEPEVQSFKDLNRETVEEYLIYLNTEATERKSYATDLSHLKTIVEMAGRMLEAPEICNLFLLTDIPRKPEKQFRAYSDSELERLNNAIMDMDEQVARAIMLHQMLGTRISDTLTLLQDCISVKDGKYVITIYQVKTRRTYKKTVNADVVALINAAIAYTCRHYPESKYIFASDPDGSSPMKYGKIQYQLMALIQEKDLRDDNGERFGVWTHMFRSTYGKKLTEMHIEEITIAKLLGHAGVSSVKHYRKMGDDLLARETKSMRQTMDDILENLVKGWSSE